MTGLNSKTATQSLVATILLGVFCITLNVFGYYIAQSFNNLLYLDMTGTCIGAMLLGPWYGAIIGAISNFILDISYDNFIDYGIVNMTGGVLIGLLSTKLRSRNFKIENFKKLFWFLIISGFILGVFCAFLALYIRFDYEWYVNQSFITEKLNDYKNGNLTSPNDVFTAKVFERGLIGNGDSIFRLFVLDFLIIIPDKLFSVAFAFCMIVFFTPRIGKFSNYLNKVHLLKPHTIVLGTLVWSIMYCIVQFYEHKQLNFAKQIDMDVLLIWGAPLLIGILLSVIYSNGEISFELKSLAPSKLPIGSGYDEYIPNERMYKVYEDVIHFITGFSALIMTLKLPFLSESFELAIQEGLGLITFFVIASILPNLIRRYT